MRAEDKILLALVILLLACVILGVRLITTK